MQNWEVSGEGEVDRFGSFTDSPVLQFMFQKLQQEPSLMAFATRKLEDESTAEEGAPVAQAQAQPRGRGRKRSGSTGGRTGSPAPVEGGNALTQEEKQLAQEETKKVRTERLGLYLQNKDKLAPEAASKLDEKIMKDLDDF